MKNKKITACISHLSRDEFNEVDVIEFAQNLYVITEEKDKVFPFQNIFGELLEGELLLQEFNN